MANYVYRDKARMQKVYAKDALKEDRNTRFYCPNPKCDAHMYICSIDGATSAYFGAKYRQYRHILNCSFGQSNGFNPNEHNESAFDFENALRNLMSPSNPVVRENTPASHNTGESKVKALRTIRQIYDMCKSYACTDEYNHVTIGQMLVDDRSFYMYPNGVFGYRIIEAMALRGYFYDSDKLEIKLSAPINDLTYTFVLSFKEKSLFKKILEYIYPNRDKILVVAGEWKSSGTFNVFCTDIESKKQITIIRR